MKTIAPELRKKRVWYLESLRCPHGKRCVALDGDVIGGMDCCGQWSVERKLCAFTESGLIRAAEVFLEVVSRGKDA